MFWAASIGFLGALASVAFGEGIRLVELALTGRSGRLVPVATQLPRWGRILIPIFGGAIVSLVLHFGRFRLAAP
jgi:CIC family chloride channel protein